jgi:transcriptional regulator with XRE-family HTH domain
MIEDTIEGDGFANLLRGTRRARGFTQEMLAIASGLGVRTIREMEQGRVRTPQRATLRILAGALGLTEPERDHFVEVARCGSPPVGRRTGP